jgi:hypothetical protein
MFAPEPPSDSDISCRREPGKLQELVAEMGLQIVEVVDQPVQRRSGTLDAYSTPNR